MLRLLLSILALAFPVVALCQPVADFTADQVSGCAPLVVNFTDYSTGTITSWTWNFGNGNPPSSLQNPSATYANPGTYNVTLVVAGPGGSNTVTKTAFITVYDKPAVAFTATGATSGCNPFSVSFSSTITPNSPGTPTYSWDFGDGNTDVGSAPTHLYTYPGTYPVSLTVTNGAGCTRTVTRTSYITVWPVPNAGFTAAQTSFCAVPAAASFTNTTVGGTTPYLVGWDFGDGGRGSGNTPTHNYTTGGGFTVIMVVTDANGCVNTVTAPAYISVNTTAPSFTAPAHVCVDAPATFVNTTPGPGIGATQWDFDDGSTGSGLTTTHVFVASGTYNVKMGTDISGCTKFLSKTVIADPKPALSISMIPPIPCPATTTVGFSASSTPPAATYNWTWLLGGSATGQNVTKTYTTNVTDQAKVVATTSFGCTDSMHRDTIMIRRILVSILPGGLCGADTLTGCFPYTIDLSFELFSSLPPPLAPCAYQIYPLPASTCIWDFGDVSPNSTSPTVQHTYPNVGTYRLKLTVTTPNGCIDSAFKYVHVDTPVTPSFYVTPLAVCTQTPVMIVNTTKIPLVDTRYTYLFDEDTVVTKDDTTYLYHKFSKPDTFEVKVITSHRGCLDSSTHAEYVEVYPPGAKFTASPQCLPSKTVDFTNKSVKATSQLWMFGDGATSTAVSPSHTYAAAGSYFVTLVAYNSTYGCIDTFREKVTIFTPFFEFTSNKNAICTGDTIRFNGAFIGPGEIKYSWIFGNYQTPYSVDAAQYDFSFPLRGWYDVKLIATSGDGCADTLTKKNFVVASRPDVKFGADPPIGCQPLSVLFKDSSTNTIGIPNIIRDWTFGDGKTVKISSGADTVRYIYNVRNLYTVKLVVVDSLGCKDSLERRNYVSVNKPDVAFTVSDDSVCAHASVLFNSTSAAQASPLKQHWDFGDGTTDTGRAPTHFYPKKGLFYVKLRVTDTVGCVDSLTLPDPVVVDAPTAAFTMSDSIAICPPLQINFTNRSTDAISYFWDFGIGGPPIFVPSPVATFGAAGLYSVYLVATNINGCTDTARAQVRVLGYNGAFDYTPLTGCAPLTVNFNTAISGIPKITWVFGDGVIVAGSDTAVSHTYLTPGPYLPSVIFSDGALCSSVSEGLDTIHVDRLDADFTWSVPCVDVPFTLTQQSSAIYQQPDSWYWVFGANDTAVGSPVTHSFTTPGNHSVTLVAGNGTGCRDTITKNVFINDRPPIKAFKDTGVCPGDPVPLYVTGGVRYTWSPNPDSMHNCPTCDTIFTHLNGPNPGEFKVFTVTGTDANGCVNKDSVRVSIKFRTDIATGQGGSICIGDTFRLHAEGADTYEWSPTSSIDSPFIASPLATPQKTTTYVVVAKEGTCDVVTQYIEVIVHSLPFFSAGPDEVIALGSAVTLQPTRNGISKIEWRPDTTLSCWDCYNPTAKPYYTRTYYATAYNEFGCHITDSVTVFVRCNGSLVFIPNTFTPNEDGKNDRFFPRGEGIERVSHFRVFNRWGQMVFERMNFQLNDERGGWDGRFNGQQLPPDVYVYTMQSTCSTGEILNWKGDVTLMR